MGPAPSAPPFAPGRPPCALHHKATARRPDKRGASEFPPILQRSRCATAHAQTHRGRQRRAPAKPHSHAQPPEHLSSQPWVHSRRDRWAASGCAARGPPELLRCGRARVRARSRLGPTSPPPPTGGAASAGARGRASDAASTPADTAAAARTAAAKRPATFMVVGVSRIRRDPWHGVRAAGTFSHAWCAAVGCVRACVRAGGVLLHTVPRAAWNGAAGLRSRSAVSGGGMGFGRVRARSL